jgi:hypothetical protein
MVFRYPVVASAGPALGSRPYQLTARASGKQRKHHVCADMIADRPLSAGPGTTSPTLPDLITKPALDSIPVILPASTAAQGTTATSPSTSSTSSHLTDAKISTGYEASTSGSSAISRIGSGALGGQDLSVLDPDAMNPHYNRSGLNGLTTGATSGLRTVSSVFLLGQMHRPVCGAHCVRACVWCIAWLRGEAAGALALCALLVCKQTVCTPVYSQLSGPQPRLRTLD